MKEALLEKFHSSLPILSRKQRLIAEYISNNYQNAAYLTARKLGDQVGVSEATVVRFAKEFGFEGYPELQRELREIVRNRLTSLQRIDLTKARMGGDNMLASVLDQDIEMIHKTKEICSKEDFNRAVDLLCSARRIYVIATRSATAIASFIKYYFSLIFEQVVLVDPSNESEVFEQLLFACDKDVVVGVSYPRYSKRVVKAVAFAAEKGAGTIALTDSDDAPIARYAEIILRTGSDVASIVDSLVAPMSLANALIVAAVLRKRDVLTERFRELENAWDAYEVYEEAGAVKEKVES